MVIEQRDAVVAPDWKSVGHFCDIFQYEALCLFSPARKMLDSVLESWYF
jgi:hypothetical protein